MPFDKRDSDFVALQICWFRDYLPKLSPIFTFKRRCSQTQRISTKWILFITREIHKPQDIFHLFDLLFRNETAESRVYCIRRMLLAIFSIAFEGIPITKMPTVSDRVPPGRVKWHSRYTRAHSFYKVSAFVFEQQGDRNTQS